MALQCLLCPLGPIGLGVTWVSFLLFFYALIAAYLSGSGAIFIDAMTGFVGVEVPSWFKMLPMLIFFSPFIYFGLSVVDHLNRYLMIAMLLAYLIIIIMLYPQAGSGKLLHTDWSFSLLSFSVVITSFGFHSTIPTLVDYLERDVKKIKQCLFFGSLIPLAIYIIWEALILSIVPISGNFGLAYAFSYDMSLSQVLQKHNNNDFLIIIIRVFSLFTIVTSFLGVAQGLFDFLKDGVKAKNHQGRLFAFILTFLPPVLFILFFEKGFITLLEYAGALVSIILGIIPILIVWHLRYTHKKSFGYQAVGNKFALLLGLVFFGFVVLLVLLKNMNFITFSTAGLI